MEIPLIMKHDNESAEDVVTYERTPFGKAMKKHFMFDPSFRNLNHGSFGTFPKAIRDKQRSLLDLCESAPDPYIRYIYPMLLDESRAACAKVLNSPAEAIVYVPNATAGVNTVLRNLVWNENGKDEIVVFSTIYGACGKTVEYVAEASLNKVTPRSIHLTYPCEDDEIVTLFKDAIKASKSEGKVPRLAVFDTISSMPGLRFPFEALTAICHEEGVLSLIDAAHAIGQIPIDLTKLNPDFFVSNCHKWLFVPRGCAVLYVPVKHQDIMRSTIPTSHGFQPRGIPIGRPSTLPKGANSTFVQNFEFVGTIDNSNYLVLPEALKWREEVCGGERAIMDYNNQLARDGAQVVADILGTHVVDNKSHSITNCCLVNVVLPITASTEKMAGKTTIDPALGWKSVAWMSKLLVDEYKTFLALMYFQDQWWVRLSGQVYLDLDDFEWAGKTLKEVCERAGKEFHE